MRKKVASLLFSITVVLALVACSGSIASNLYIRDLLEIGEDPSVIYFTTATLEMESPGDDEVDKLAQKIKEWFREAENFRMATRDYSSYLVADIKIPVHDRSIAAVDNKRDLISLVVDTDEMGNIEFGYRFDASVFKEISAYVKDEFWSTLSIEDWNLSLDLHNDTRTTQGIMLHTVYANHRPVLFAEEFSLKVRDTINLVFPDILRDYAYAQGEVIIGILWQ